MTEDNLEAVKRDIAAYKAERGPEVFVCSSDSIDETGYGEELVCSCDDPEAPPWKRCAIHDPEAVD